MPEIARFYGIVITINYNDHSPAHFHARYGEHRASVGVDGHVISGWLPPRAADMVGTWASLHRDELLEDWLRARDQLPLAPIDPLD